MRINEIFAEVQASFIDWNGFFKDPNYSRTRQDVSWPNAGEIVVRDEVTVGDLQRLSDRRQFSFRVSSDGSLIQMGYRFRRTGELVDARLGFYKFPSREDFGELAVEPVSGDGELDSVSWLRMDFSSNLQARVGHTPCHLHVSGLPAVRFAVYGVPSPAQFVEFVISHFYTADYKSARLSKDGAFESYQRINSINTKATKTGLEPRELLHCLPHFFIPGN